MADYTGDMDRFGAWIIALLMLLASLPAGALSCAREAPASTCSVRCCEGGGGSCCCDSGATRCECGIESDDSGRSDEAPAAPRAANPVEFRLLCWLPVLVLVDDRPREPTHVALSDALPVALGDAKAIRLRGGVFLT